MDTKSLAPVIIGLVAIAALVYCHASQPADPISSVDGKVPIISFDETIHDFGIVPQGKNVTHVFAVRNNGEAPLKLIKAKGS